MGLSFFNQRRAREAEKAKLEAQAVKPITEPAPVEVLEKTEPIEAAEIIEVENEAPKIDACETEIFEAEKPKKKTDAEKLKRKK